jgi:anaerobic magnesium-protoporphyrin IX monomethyl ester cyclase
VVEAQGEQTLLRVLDELPKGGGLASIPNLALFDEDGEMRFTPREAEARAMNETAVSWDKIPRKYLRHTLPLNTSRGCFYRCRFCTYHWLFPEVQYKSLEVLRQELRGVQALGFVRHIRFTDDNFTADKARLRAVLEMMIEQGFDFTWSSFARASALTPGLVKLMKASGCDFVDMGIESGSQIILDNMDKRLKREQSLEAIRLLNDHGIPSRGSFIIGYPGETEKTFSETVDLINQSGLPYYHPYLFYYSWNTLVHKERERYALQGLGLAWRHRTMDAVEASYLMTQMVRLIEPGLTDGLSYIEEIYKLLRGEGYSAEEILALFKLKRELQLVGSQSSLKRPFSEAAEYIFRGLKSIVHHRSPGVGA